ncbi:hypothetical protein NECID01_0654 [Nematocida sp. AWRm77]|nr:hypothetical protein NECID01_0654 [Nematocida sp. AWRm77]
MKLEDFCKEIESQDEFLFCRETMEKISTVELASIEEEEKLWKALALCYWKLPKQTAQEEWAACVVEKLAERKSGKDLLLHFMEHLKRIWSTVGIRRKKKFVKLLECLIEKVTQLYDTPFAEFIKKGPCADYDLPIMKQVFSSRSAKSLTEKEIEYLLNHLLAHPDTYFRNFFLEHVIPVLKETGISQKLAEAAYSAGSKENTSNLMREVLYEMHECGK